MKKDNYIFKLGALFLAFIAVPSILYFLGNFEKRDFLMESLSLITILGFTLLLSQFFSTRMNKKFVKSIRMVNVLKIHKIIGYVFISILFLHPFFIIVPKFFDNGVTPTDAFLRIITTFSSLGIILGLIAYTSIIIILITSFFRFKLHLKYRTWRNLHAYLTLLFVITATWHVINLGRHSNTSFSIYYILMVASGIYYLLKTYLFKTSKK
ncbi:ferric reductase-like transmembrane domain-containing protein [Lutibacter sp. TH_r2]|uniref:ferric reductase-like transmembrane domain-containing protein n=1 Tax=Lutibacter sp. TH_r2 TaxID=3082083 RepID=UPI0029551F95|nr:ferric reductase-like transmembrane domain-containing protein [Lutibacter sp. TH_r2]MDV7186356.1 ferric reductase-like transmembrane domain-containing protein [Lutibacter sp. TH_r2]